MFKLIISDDQHLVFCGNRGLVLVKKFESAESTKTKHSYIGNFLPTNIIRVAVNNDGITVPSVKFNLIFDDRTEEARMSEQIIVLEDELDSLDWFRYDRRCLLNPTFSKKGKGYLAYIIRAALSKAEEESEYHINRLGTHKVGNIHVFNAGNELIWPVDIENKPAVIWKPQPNVRLVVDPLCSEQEAVAGVLRVIKLNRETGRIMFAFNILNVIREVFIASGIKLGFCLFLTGPTGCKKTTYSAFQTQLYNRDEPLEPLTRLNSTIAAAVNLLYDKADLVKVFDDLFPVENRGIHKEQEKTLLEITRVIGDGVEPARMKGKKVAKAPPRCGVMFTGEYYVGRGSDAARLLQIRMTTPIDNDKMTACQREQLVLSTFYHYFLSWYITNFDQISDLLKGWASVYRSAKSDIHPRLEETQFCLEAAYKLFLEYRFEQGFISEDRMLNEYNSFFKQLRAIIREQNSHVNQGNGGIQGYVDYLLVIRTLYHEKQFRLVESVKDFDLEEHDGVIHKEYLCFRKDKLMAKIHSVDSSAEFDDVLQDLKEQRAIRTGSGNNSRKIGGISSRFYVIKLDMLQ